MSTTRGKQNDIKEPKGFVCFFGQKEPVTWERETYRYVYKVRRLKRENDRWLANKKIFDEKMDKEEIFLFRNNSYEVLCYSDETPQPPITQTDNTYIEDNQNNKQIHNAEVENEKATKSDKENYIFVIDSPEEKTEQPFQVHFTYVDEQVENNISPIKKKAYKRATKRSKKDHNQPLQLQFAL